MTLKQSPNGWITLNKSPGISSFFPIRKLKKFFDVKIGHTGTLDPFATGVLPIAFGEATKLISFSTDKLKKYKFSLQLGIETDTLDIEGEVIKTSDKRNTKEEIELCLPNFIGKIKQVPPRYSALKINGIRAYNLARNGVEFNPKEREVFIKDLGLINFDNENNIVECLVTCGSGTYIRSLARDLAYKIGNVGHLIKLERTMVGNFNINNAILLDNILELVHNANFQDYLEPVDIVLDDILAINLTEIEAKKVKNGVKINLEAEMPESEFIKAYFDNKLVAIGKISENHFIPVRVFNY